MTLRAIGVLSDEELGFRLRAGMRSPRELIFHIYRQEQMPAEAAQQGRFTIEALQSANPEDEAAAVEVLKLATVSDAQMFAEACHQVAEDVARALSDDDLAWTVESPSGKFPVWRYFDFAYDEHWRHRGQLYAYLRLLGKEPPMLYDYDTASD